MLTRACRGVRLMSTERRRDFINLEQIGLTEGKALDDLFLVPLKELVSPRHVRLFEAPPAAVTDVREHPGAEMAPPWTDDVLRGLDQLLELFNLLAVVHLGLDPRTHEVGRY